MPHALGHLRGLLSRAVGARLLADVPVGLFLSGGIDSSLILALMSELTSAPVRTFTVSFTEKEYDEAFAATEVANNFATDHHVIKFTASDALRATESLGEVYDEPLADPAQIPTLSLCRAARKEVTVALTGDGGDEIFGGYQRYNVMRLLGPTFRIPASGRRAVSRGVGMAGSGAISTLSRLECPGLGAFHRSNPAQKGHLARRLLEAGDIDRSYQELLSIQPQMRPSIVTAPLGMNGWLGESGKFRFEDHAILRDVIDYLPGAMLTKVDRAAMSVGLESRAPLLDPDVFEFAWRLPRSSRMSLVQGKLALRRLAGELIPGRTAGSPKRGFGLPLREWLRGTWRGWADSIFASYSAEPVPQAYAQEVWRRFLGGDDAGVYRVWSLLMCSLWYRRWVS